jgi:hypothetical protein
MESKSSVFTTPRAAKSSKTFRLINITILMARMCSISANSMGFKICMSYKHWDLDFMILNPILFALIEHILAIRMVILIKRKVLEDFAALGVVKTEDFDSICHCVIEPALKTLTKFVPTMDFLPYDEEDKTIFQRLSQFHGNS